MSPSRIAAVVTGVAAIALGVVTVSGPTVPDEHWGMRGGVVNALGLVTFAAMAVASTMLPDALRLARTGRIGVRAAELGLVSMSVESVASQVHGGNTLGILFVLGLLLTVVGYAVAGIDGLRRPGARALALLPLVAMLVGIGAGDHGGFVALGAAWCGLTLLAGSAAGHDSEAVAAAGPVA
jgi:hypothetical protein